MTKRGRAANFTLPNGDIVQKVLIRHRDGKVSIKRRKVACGIGTAPRQKPTAERVAISQSVVPPKKKLKKALVSITARPKPARQRIHSQHTIFANGSYVETISSSYVQTTNQLPKILRRYKARTGSHVDQFQRDHEAISRALKSLNLDGTRGGHGLPLPLAQIQAQDRIKEFRAIYPESYLVCKLVIVDGVVPEMIPVPKETEGGIARLVQTSVDDLAKFYSPRRTRPDKALVEFAKSIEKAGRNA